LTATLAFLDKLAGKKLQGSLFVITSMTGRDIRHFSEYPDEEEVLFPPNSQFRVDKVLTQVEEKDSMLSDLSAYDLSELDVYVLQQLA